MLKYSTHRSHTFSPEHMSGQHFLRLVLAHKVCCLQAKAINQDSYADALFSCLIDGWRIFCCWSWIWSSAWPCAWGWPGSLDGCSSRMYPECVYGALFLSSCVWGQLSISVLTSLCSDHRPQTDSQPLWHRIGHSINSANDGITSSNTTDYGTAFFPLLSDLPCVLPTCN